MTSSKGRPTIWKPSGSPAPENPHGTDKAGSPSPFQGRVSRENCFMRAVTSSVVPAFTSARAGAGAGITGAASASTSEKTSRMNSRARRARRRRAWR